MKKTRILKVEETLVSGETNIFYKVQYLYRLFWFIPIWMDAHVYKDMIANSVVHESIAKFETVEEAEEYCSIQEKCVYKGYKYNIIITPELERLAYFGTLRYIIDGSYFINGKFHSIDEIHALIDEKVKTSKKTII